MKRFHFSLQAVLAWRERQELAAHEAHTRALTREIEVRNRLAAHESEGESFRAHWLRLVQAGCPVLDIVRCQEHGTVLESRRRTCQRELLQAGRQVQEARTKMLEARQKRELMDKLRERLGLRHDLEAARAAQSELDDMVSARHGLRAESCQPSA